MDTYIIVISCIAVLLSSAVIIYYLSAKKQINSISKSETQLTTAKKAALNESPNNSLPIQFESIAALTENEESALVEITDSKLLARVDGVIPGTIQMATNAAAVHGYNQAVQATGQLYQAIIPSGATLANSRSMNGAVRGFYHGAKHIRGHANFVPVDGDVGRNLASISTANAAMGVASMVVGQYYMTQINNRLDSINTEIKAISSFQNNEYRAKVFALIAAVQKASVFQIELVESDELRKRELDELKRMEHECATLLGHANLELQDFTKNRDLPFDEYEISVRKANGWFQYQQILLELMSKICELTYVLNLGAASKESCYAVYLPYVKQVEGTLEQLNMWHNDNVERLELDIDSSRRKRKGFDGFFMSIPGLFNEDLRYRPVSKNTSSMIRRQIKGASVSNEEKENDLFKKDVRLIVKDGRLYYLPDKNQRDQPLKDE